MNTQEVLMNWADTIFTSSNRCEICKRILNSKTIQEVSLISQNKNLYKSMILECGMRQTMDLLKESNMSIKFDKDDEIMNIEITSILDDEIEIDDFVEYFTNYSFDNLNQDLIEKYYFILILNKNNKKFLIMNDLLDKGIFLEWVLKNLNIIDFCHNLQKISLKDKHDQSYLHKIFISSSMIKINTHMNNNPHVYFKINGEINENCKNNIFFENLLNFGLTKSQNKHSSQLLSNVFFCKYFETSIEHISWKPLQFLIEEYITTCFHTDIEHKNIDVFLKLLKKIDVNESLVYKILLTKCNFDTKNNSVLNMIKILVELQETICEIIKNSVSNSLIEILFKKLYYKIIPYFNLTDMSSLNSQTITLKNLHESINIDILEMFVMTTNNINKYFFELVDFVLEKKHMNCLNILNKIKHLEITEESLTQYVIIIDKHKIHTLHNFSDIFNLTDIMINVIAKQKNILSNDILIYFNNNIPDLNNKIKKIIISQMKLKYENQILSISKKRSITELWNDNTKCTIVCAICCVNELNRVYECGHTICGKCCENLIMCPYCRKKSTPNKFILNNIE